MNVEQAQDHYSVNSADHADDVSPTIAADLRRKRALECIVTRDVMYSLFGIRFEITTALQDFYTLDGPYDGGCDHHYIDNDDERVILIQSKMSDFQQDDTWEMNYAMDAGELSRIEGFCDGVIAQTAKQNFVGNVGPAREVALGDRVDEIYDAIVNNNYSVNLVQICSGTIANEWDAIQLPQIEAKGWYGFAIDRDDIAHHATEAIALDTTGGLPNPIELKFIQNHASTDDPNIIHGFVTGRSIKDAVQQESWRLTRQNLRHFKGSKATTANKGMVETLDDEPSKFHLYNNGLRITCSEMTNLGDETLQDSAGNDIIIERWELGSAQIVNGGQTSFSLRNYNGVTDLNDVKVNCIVIKEDDVDILRNVARYSNTQESLDDWDFHSDSPELLEIQNAIDLIRFQICGDERRFYFDQKSGAFEFLTDADKLNHRILRAAGRPIYHRLHPKDYAKASLVLTQEPHVAKSSARRFHSTNATGKYTQIFVNEVQSTKSVLYTHVILNQAKSHLKATVAAGGLPWLNQAIACCGYKMRVR